MVLRYTLRFHRTLVWVTALALAFGFLVMIGSRTVSDLVLRPPILALAAWVCIRWLIRYVSTHSFVAFAWYRIAFGILIFATAYWNLVEWKA